MSVGITMRQGVIKKIKEQFGFIRGDDGVDRFFHASALVQGVESFGSLREGQRVEFVDVDTAPKGPRAERIAVLSVN